MTTTVKEVFYPALEKMCAELAQEFHLISDERKNALNKISAWIKDQEKYKRKKLFQVICTHNSRRSHFGQVWLQISAIHYQIDQVYTYSGGTEATAVNGQVIVALQQCGVKIHADESKPQGSNPIYYAELGKKVPVMKLFSKKYSDSSNPDTGFAAIMVCTEADEACPFVEGAAIKFSLPFEDPKKFDNTPLCADKYLERSRQIGREMLYICSQATA